MASVKEIKQLTARDLAFGIGRKATSEEVKQLIESTKNDNFVSLEKFEKNYLKRQRTLMYLPIKLSDTAQATLISVINYIDSINTIGAGEKWYNRFKKILLRYTFAKKYPLCRIKDFAVNGYSCISINDWVIIFKIENDTFMIQYIIYGSLLY